MIKHQSYALRASDCPLRMCVADLDDDHDADAVANIGVRWRKSLSDGHVDQMY